MKCLVVVPAYNEERSIAATVAEIRAGFPEASIVVVNDGSADCTSQVARSTGVAVLDLPFNLGIGGSVQAGFLYAMRNGFDAAVQVDGDGQHPAGQIARLIEPLAAGRADIVVGSRFLPESTGFRSSASRRGGIYIFRVVMRLLTGLTITDATSGFRACNRRVIELFAERYPRDYPEPEALLIVARRGLRVLEVPVEMRARSDGRSSIRGLRSLYYMVKVVLAMLMEAMRRKD